MLGHSSLEWSNLIRLMMKKILFLLTFSIILQASSLDTFNLNYTGKTKECTLTKNSKVIPTFDERFKKKKPINDYDCYAIQKEQYKSCKVYEKNDITALVFAYGVYENTNLIMAFKSNAKVVDASIVVQCSKTEDLK